MQDICGGDIDEKVANTLDEVRVGIQLRLNQSPKLGLKVFMESPMFFGKVIGVSEVKPVDKILN